MELVPREVALPQAQTRAQETGREAAGTARLQVQSLTVQEMILASATQPRTAWQEPEEALAEAYSASVV
jgi:hypothetical protein|tara:strand:- start:716 stop:922 length:207 start_codon:yes stop_codon:yes gene_type:complete